MYNLLRAHLTPDTRVHADPRRAGSAACAGALGGEGVARARLRAGGMLDLPADETRAVRERIWLVAPGSARLHQRWVEISPNLTARYDPRSQTGCPTVHGRPSRTPTPRPRRKWSNGAYHLRAAIEGNDRLQRSDGLITSSPADRQPADPPPRVATCRKRHLPGRRGADLTSRRLFDFGLYFFHCTAGGACWRTGSARNLSLPRWIRLLRRGCWPPVFRSRRSAASHRPRQKNRQGERC